METTPRPFRVLNLFAFCALCFNWCAQAQPPDAPAKHDHSAAATDANPEFAEALMSSMEKMDSDMRAAPMTGDPDHDFAVMMSPHHQGAVDMAKVFLLHSKDPALRRLAQEIIVTQGQEIEVMRLRLVALQAGGAVAPEPPVAMEATPVSSRDRVYTGDQTSNTVSVIDPSSNKLLGVIRLGDPVPGALSPLYRASCLCME